MKKRVRKITNFFAFNLLFFALYLNFIHKDKAPVTGLPQNAAFSGNVIMANQEQTNEKKSDVTVARQSIADKKPESTTEPLKLSIN